MSVPELDEDLSVRNVLVPTDFSAQSYQALLYALAIVKYYASSVTPLHVIQAHGEGALHKAWTAGARGVRRGPYDADWFREGTNSVAHGDGLGFDGIGIGHTRGACFDHSFVCTASLEGPDGRCNWWRLPWVQEF
jgi:Universal stress protein family